MDTNRLKVTADDALRIAQENGGKEARLKFDKQCSISLLLFPEKYPGWLITYYGAYEVPDEFQIDTVGRLVLSSYGGTKYESLEFQIDPYNGEIIK